MKNIYMDHAAATPASKASLKAMVETMKKFPANPSAIHQEGRKARVILDSARKEVASILSAHPDEIIFTSSATEANNLAILGVVRRARMQGVQNPRIVISAIEHPSVFETARALEKEGVALDILPVDKRGLVNSRDLRKLITSETVLVSVMYANNEIGTIEPIIEIAKEARHARKINQSVYPYVHTDGAQAGNYLDLNVLRLGVDLMTLSSGKVYGPRGVAVLFVRRGMQIVQIMHGGDHEFGYRPGTESPSLAVGFSVALREALNMREKESIRISKLRDLLFKTISKKIDGIEMNGDIECGLPSILNISVRGVESDALVLYFDAIGVAVSGKSSCKSADSGQSHVILALRGEDAGAGSVRFSLGRETTREHVLFVTREFPRIVALLRDMRAHSDI